MILKNQNNIFWFIVATCCILFAGVMLFDFWIYKNTALLDAVKVDEDVLEKVYFLDRALLEKSEKEILEKNKFLQNPISSLLKDRF